MPIHSGSRKAQHGSVFLCQDVFCWVAQNFRASGSGCRHCISLSLSLLHFPFISLSCPFHFPFASPSFPMNFPHIHFNLHLISFISLHLPLSLSLRSVLWLPEDQRVNLYPLGVRHAEGRRIWIHVGYMPTYLYTDNFRYCLKSREPCAFLISQ